MTKDEGLLSRWSKRKLAKQQDDVAAENQQKLPEKLAETEPDTPIEQADLPLWQQDDVDSQDKQAALAALFRQDEFKAVDHLNEYDEDFTRFSGLGDIVTQEMKRMIKLAEKKIQAEQKTQAELEPSPEQKQQSSEIEVVDRQDSNEEDKSA